MSWNSGIFVGDKAVVAPSEPEDINYSPNKFIMEHPATIRDILYGICNTRDANLPLFQRELKAYILRRGVLHQREPHDSPTKPP